jgi:pimeloyl-ACP methyl ester carboxylesterase
LSRVLKSVQSDQIHIVAHSLGGLVTLRALELYPDARVRHVVLLGSPVAGSFSGRRLANFHAGRMLMGANSHIWGDRHSVKAPEGVDVGVIAGTLPLGLGRFIGKLPHPHDGVVSVAETKLDNATDSILLPVSHSAMLFSGSVGSQVCHFLQQARFIHDGTR